MSDLAMYQEALKKASSTIEQLVGEIDRLNKNEPVAIIGMGCRLPGGANSPDEYWRLLSEGRDAVSPIPSERWPASRYFDENAETPGMMYIREAGFLDCSPYDFDPRFFGISPKEARALDPQQRLLLEVAWEALEHAGINPASLQGSRTGVFIGISSSDYECAHLNSGDPSLIDPYSMTGITFSTAAGRISYTLGLEGPCIPVDTACSSSLVALHLACSSLKAGECDMALVGGVNLMLAPEPLIAFCKLRALSPEGRCKTFDASANGYGRGEGCGMIVVKRLETARRDDDRILALVKGSALNNDGRSNGFTTPNGLAQRRVICAALEAAALQPGDIDYVEAHGTGTPLGDPIEVEALAAAFGKGRDASHPLLIGSAKTNIGHLEAAAGVAGLIKLVLALNREMIPPHLHFSTPNPHVAWGDMPLKVVSGGASWQRSARPRRAGISGFGFSGTNAHVIVEEAPLPEKPRLTDGRTGHLLIMSAADETALRAVAGRYAEYLAGPDLPSLAAICNSAATGRNRFPAALAVAGTTPHELAHRLSLFAGQGTTAGLYHRSAPVADARGPVFLFTGQGSQYPEMGKELYETSPLYRESLDRCDALFAPLLGLSSRDLMHGGSEEELARTIYTQPAIFSLEYSLAQLWQSWGVVPSAVLGHSIGEFVAACIAGVLSLEDAVTLVAHRGRLMNALPAGGVMAAVLCPEAKALPLLVPYAGRVSVAAVNSPGTVVISGEQEGVAAALEALKQQGVSSQYLTVSHAFHSHLMEPALDEFERVAATLAFHEPRVPVISNVTGRAAEGGDLRTAAYWRQHLRGAVRFSDSIEYLKQLGHDLFLEVGASATLSSFVRQGAGTVCRSVASLKRGVSPWSTLTGALGELFAAGAAIDWKGYDAPYRAGVASIPTYPFQRERYIMNPVREPGGGGTPDRLSVAGDDPVASGTHSALSTLLYRQLWRELPLGGALASPRGRWLVLTDQSPFCSALVAAIKGSGVELTEVAASTGNLSSEELRRVLEKPHESGSPLTGVISLLGDSLNVNLNLVRALLAARITPRLFLVTAAVHDPTGMEKEIHPEGAAQWGFGASVAAEVPELCCTLLDLSPRPGADELAALLRELAAADAEERIALRGGHRFVARLVRGGA
ncbi:MAG: type I polyketide synthase, partial [Pelobacteraceae bacterium]